MAVGLTDHTRGSLFGHNRFVIDHLDQQAYDRLIDSID
jgi:hypothetical protein